MSPKMRMTQVASVQDLSPHIKRIVLTGESLSDFPLNKEGAHVKAIFPNPDSGEQRPRLGMYDGFKKWMRSYTVRKFDEHKSELTLDFAVNDHQGLATNWASQAKPGDYLGIAGPGEVRHTDFYAKKHLFFGDLTALPAIASTIEKLPENAVGQAWIQVPVEQDIQTIKAPEGIEIKWLVTEDKQTGEFLKALEGEPENLEEAAIFIACEANVVKELKSHLNTHCQYNPSKLYASAYWNKKK